MNDPHAHQRFVEALLSLEDKSSASDYRAYRQRLAQQIALAARQQQPRRRFRWKAHLAAAMLLLATGLVFSALRQVRESSPPSVILVQPRDFDGKPYTDVVQAQLVALVRTEAPRVQRGAMVYPLRVERILKKETQQPTARFACDFREKPATGEQYLACLSENEAGWSLQSITRVDERYRKERLPGVERCVRIQEASCSADPALVYRQLLAPEAGGVDEPAGVCFSCRPDPQSASVLLARMQTFREQLSKQIAPVPRPLPAPEEVTRVAAALEGLHEARAAELVADCARLSPPGGRGGLYHCLPGLCRRAPPEVRKSVQRLLQEELDNRSAHPDDGRQAREALKRMSQPR